MTRPTLLLSDLHLPDAPSPLRDCFLAFLAGPARQAQAVYLLGDLFEVWIGDAEGLEAYAAEARALRELSDAGVTVAFMAGNRDFLVGSAFAKAAGLKPLADPVVVDLAGMPTLLSHGDVWCTNDVGYQRWRRFSRNRLAQAIFRRLPLRWRQAVGGTARQRSQIDKQAKSAEIMDVNASAIARAFEHAGVRRIIHGHTHRPADHRDNAGHERIVLADWRLGHCEYLQVDDAGIHRIRLATPAVAAKRE